MQEIVMKSIDNGKAFDWGRTSADYAKYRDIYPTEFYKKIVDRGLCTKGQTCLDIGTGTGVIPRNMYKYGADWYGVDISEEQIEQARILAENSCMKIDFSAVSAENIDFQDNYFDVVTASQCFWYFDQKTLLPKLKKIIKPDGRLVLLFMAWLPFEDKIAYESEQLVLKYNPDWTGGGLIRKPVDNYSLDGFITVSSELYDLRVSFTKESWHGRIKACRGIGASLSQDKISKWENEHMRLLDRIAPDTFEILHYATIIELKPDK